MPTYPARCLVLGRTKLAESDLIITFIAQDGSQIRAVGKGARKPSSRIGGSLELFSVVDVLFARGKNLDIICEASLVDPHTGCRCDLEHSCAASSICEACRKLTLPSQSQPHLFDMTAACLTALASTDPLHGRLLCAAYLIKVTSLLGYRPQLHECVACGQACALTNGAQMLFSVRHGGVVCEQCAPQLPDAIPYDTNLLAWLDVLIYSTYEALCDCACDDVLVCELLSLCNRWLIDHVDIHLRSLSFVFTGF